MTPIKKHWMLLLLLPSVLLAQLPDTLPPLINGMVPQTFDQLWAGFDPRLEPLDVEVLDEWEKDGVVLKVLRYRVGVFKGKKAMIAAVYGYPKGGQKLPGLVQIHGGGQYAQFQACATNAKRGYATISISWAGRIIAPNYSVRPANVKKFWEGNTEDPAYKVTTDWGAIDSYHAPCRYPKNTFTLNPPSESTIDSVPSPRNSGWFPCTMAARRALTFLEKRPEIDGEKLGVYGHSMGGKLTVLTAGSDSRVKAAAPSCGGVSDRKTDPSFLVDTISDAAYLKRITCPIMFLSPANDFHGRINDLQTALTEIKSKDWRMSCGPHHNHQDTGDFEVATQIWFDQHLKDAFVCPKTPVSKLKLKTQSGVPQLLVMPDNTKSIISVDVYYTQQGQIDGLRDNSQNTINRFWHHSATSKKGKVWSADVPILSVDKPLWVYANVVYSMDKPITGAGYYYGEYTVEQFNISSKMEMIDPSELQSAKVKPTLKSSMLIESFKDNWRKEWFNYKTGKWWLYTHKLYDPQWIAPTGAKLAIKVRSKEANKLVVSIDGYQAEVDLKGGLVESVSLSPGDFKKKDVALTSWVGAKELGLLWGKTGWLGSPPEFSELRWVVK